jgi:peptide/nickel transport system permease protein
VTVGSATASATELSASPGQTRTGRRTSAWEVFSKSPAAVVGAAIVALLIVVGLTGPWLAPYDPVELDLLATNSRPTLAHPFGTDDFGRDIFSRVILGTGNTLGLAGGAVLLAALLGVALGLSAGYYGGWVDVAIMRVADVLLAFPGLLLALVLVTIIGPSAVTIVVVLAVTHLPRYARLIRGVVLTLRQREYVQAARVLGARSGRIMVRHVLPNSIAPLIVYATLDLGWMIVAVAGLSFLGFGLQPPAQSWGSLLAEGRQFLALAPWIATFPGLAIAISVLALNIAGDGLRDALDPRLRHQI